MIRTLNIVKNNSLESCKIQKVERTLSSDFAMMAVVP